MCETQLENILIVDDPRQPVADLLLSMNEVFASERFNRVLPAMKPGRESEAERMAQSLIDRYGRHWELPQRPQRQRGKQP